jgi:hypothetical protein
MGYTILESFFVSFLAIIVAQWLWKLLMGPKISIIDRGLSEPHPVNGIQYYKIGVENKGLTAAKSAVVYVRLEVGSEKDFIPKWDSIPEATIAGYTFLFDYFQRIDIPPNGIHKELVPLFIVPTKLLPTKDYEPKKAYIFSNFHHYSATSVKELEIPNGLTKASLSIACENYYCKFSLEISFSNGQISLSKIKSEYVNMWIYRKGVVEQSDKKGL